MLGALATALLAPSLALPPVQFSEPAVRPGAPGVPTDQNVLFVLIDDVGVPEYSVYGEASDYPTTPVLDSLAAAGVLFERVWSNPSCSPTRAQILTGRHGYRTGIGWVPPFSDSLSFSEFLLPEALDVGTDERYDHAFIGKWHLSDFTSQGGAAPNLHGFDHTDVREGNVTSYFSWTNYTNGLPAVLTGYTPTHTVDAALDWLATAQEPWFAHVSFNAAHFPFITPPPGTYTTDLSSVEPGDPRPYFKAMVESVDFELGRLLAGLGPQLERTTILFMGDNGSPGTVIAPPWPAAKAKGTTFEGGVRVPLIAWASWIDQPGRTCDALISAVDVYDSVLELAGAPLGSLTDPDAGLQGQFEVGIPSDSVSFVPYLLDASTPPLRETVFAEWFRQGDYKRVVRDSRYKLHRYRISGDLTQRFHDISQDPFESLNLLDGTLTAPQQAAYQVLANQLNATPLPAGY